MVIIYSMWWTRSGIRDIQYNILPPEGRQTTHSAGVFILFHRQPQNACIKLCIHFVGSQNWINKHVYLPNNSIWHFHSLLYVLLFLRNVNANAKYTPPKSICMNICCKPRELRSFGCNCNRIATSRETSRCKQKELHSRIELTFLSFIFFSLLLHFVPFALVFHSVAVFYLIFFGGFSSHSFVYSGHCTFGTTSKWQNSIGIFHFLVRDTTTDTKMEKETPKVLTTAQIGRKIK